MDDRRIIALLWQRAESALDALAEKFGRGLLALSRNILPDLRDAEEAVSDTYLALWNAIPPASPDPLSPYIYKVGRNTALNRRRQDTAQKRCGYEVSLEELSGCLPGPALEARINARELGRTVDAFLADQSQDTRIIFLRRYWFGDSVKDIAKRMSMKESAVSVRLLRTREKLKEHLIKEGYYG